MSGRIDKSAKHLQKLLGDCCGAGRVLAGDQLPVDDHMDLPVSDFGVVAAKALKFVFDQERDDIGQADRRFFGIGESGDFAVLDQRFAISPDDMT